MTRLEVLSRRLGELQAETEKAHAERNLAILELRAEGWGLDRLASAAGVTKSRMQQLVNALEREA